MPKLLLVLLLFICSCNEAIMHDLTETEVNKLMTLLIDVNIDAESARQPDGKWSIEVDKKDKLQALRHIQNQRIFKTKRKAEKPKSAFVSSREEQRFAHERSLSSEIEQTILSLDGVLECRVHLNLPRRDPIFGHTLDKETQGSGSVLIVTEKWFKADNDSIAGLVSGAAGISKEYISVMLSTAKAPLALNTQEKINTSVLPKNKEETEVKSFFSNISSNQVLISILILIVGMVLIFLRKVNLKKLKLKSLHEKLELSASR